MFGLSALDDGTEVARRKHATVKKNPAIARVLTVGITEEIVPRECRSDRMRHPARKRNGKQTKMQAHAADEQ